MIILSLFGYLKYNGMGSKLLA